MAFDRTNPADLAALKALVEGHADYVPGSTSSALGIANSDSEQVTMAPLLAGRLVGYVGMFPDELDKHPKTAVLLQSVAALGTDTDVTEFLPALEAMVGADSAVVLAAKGNTRALTRAEVAFGEGVRISRDDWYAARDS
jgi:hypothetical protein